MDTRRIHLSEKDIPQAWYNIQADLPSPCPPPLHPATKKPATPEDLAAIFPKALISQEMSTERWIPIPDEVRRIYSIWRPTPLVRARSLEKALKTPARIYFKDESVSPPGSHKPNTALAQAWYNKQEGITRLSTETGAGQWGASLAFACTLLDMECKVYMVKVSYQQKPYRRSMMHLWGATVLPSPTDQTNAGRSILQQDPDCLGSLGIAISEAVEEAATRPDTNYSLGSVLNHVLLHQTIIGLEAEKQIKEFGDFPDVVVACVGGGSNFGGIAFPFLRYKLTEGKDIRFIAAEPQACPTLSRGQYRYDYGDTTMLTPLLKMFTLGHTFMPAGIHAGGLRYHGMSPLISQAAALKLIEPKALYQTGCFEAAKLFAATEGIIPAPESSHAIKAACDEAIRCRDTGKEECILFNLSGHGICDLASYDRYLSGELEDFEYPKEKIEEAMKALPEI
ncbi:MAG TPA: TrpB-like pyridoxal phosphate-dependent enzyme [Phycisphaerae bacterium]|jgi:tryptophan synthase beta chain|nr:TrpB-like pyridoxal phosphate-dependent enzyme [Phycisphaerae bacterium]HOB74010.1 TrpB-like pyridoxal phosphate-dependent enzyme [Phycisphaerae bacterium]HOJ53859.1 TrpB-like pyridoxal phosphate-dependent enzyme [Phycisphaerae bacterium]HOL26190.1 TrpB-like pyridoxal phosphate-dependent enzyme [Phycisphaerae bacterium]HPP20177.1 TrpB-like pyridoxal phosphate-dependent enzyme [Phycisphaerae bacterium]